MMNTDIEKNRLHDLIHGLSKSDKAYLKKYSKIFVAKGETKHKIFYAHIESMEKYSFDDLKKKLEKYGGYRRFKNAENELYHQILEDLVVLKSKKRPTWQYYIEHMKLGYLFLGGKFDEALKQFDLLDKLKDESNNVTIDYLYHKFHYHHLASLNVSRDSSEFEKLKEKENMLRESLKNIELKFLLEAAVFNFENYRFSSFNKTKSDFIAGLKQFEIEYLEPLPASIDINKKKMFSVYYHIFCLYYLTVDNREQLNVYSHRFYDTLKRDKNKYNYAHAYANAIHFRAQYLILARDEEVYLLLEELKNLIKRDDYFELKSFLHVMYCQLSLLGYSRFNDLEMLGNFIEEERVRSQETLGSSSHRTVLSTNFQWAMAFFKLKRMKDAQFYLDNIFDKLGKIKEASNKILIYARVLDIMIHFELKNYDNIKYYIDNLEKEMERNGQLISFDKLFFRHLRKLNQQLYTGRKIEKSQFLLFMEEQCNQDRIESYVSFLDFKNWLEQL